MSQLSRANKRKKENKKRRRRRKERRGDTSEWASFFTRQTRRGARAQQNWRLWARGRLSRGPRRRTSGACRFPQSPGVVARRSEDSAESRRFYLDSDIFLRFFPSRAGRSLFRAARGCFGAALAGERRACGGGGAAAEKQQKRGASDNNIARARPNHHHHYEQHAAAAAGAGRSIDWREFISLRARFVCSRFRLK